MVSVPLDTGAGTARRTNTLTYPCLDLASIR